MKIHYGKKFPVNVINQPFTVNENTYDKDGKITGNKKREVTEITLTNCEKYGSCIGWTFGQWRHC